jgi:hypothetical protein
MLLGALCRLRSVTSASLEFYQAKPPPFWQVCADPSLSARSSAPVTTPQNTPNPQHAKHFTPFPALPTPAFSHPIP